MRCSGSGKEGPGEGPTHRLQAGREPVWLKQCPQPLASMKTTWALKKFPASRLHLRPIKAEPWEQGQGIRDLKVTQVRLQLGRGTAGSGGEVGRQS